MDLCFVLFALYELCVCSYLAISSPSPKTCEALILMLDGQDISFSRAHALKNIMIVAHLNN